jgi:ABC-2 type transport system ATP-binding protein
MSTAFSLQGLVKRYPGFTLGPLDLNLNPGSAVGLVGPNGAGKTTTLHCLVGLTQADEGSVGVFGQESGPGWKSDLGYVGEVHPFYEHWSGARNLTFLSYFFPGWRSDRAEMLAKRFDLELGRQVRHLSRGDRVKLALVAALAHSPKLLVLDEPTGGLDPVVRADFLETLWELRENEESSIVYSTHILSDITRLADELAVLDRGKLVLRARQDHLVEQWGELYFRMSGEPPSLTDAFDHRKDGRQHKVLSSNRERTIAQLQELGAEDIRVFNLGIDEITVAILRQAKPRGEL